ncbi:xylosidase: arabinofuranosidase [Colletotrichum karsti]|uniref:Xylosidase: arabinofuranosidase n=1 Tax=Colletotrichum karsti TaxID=1095194 RepID=A0A9P6LKJ6_9PEZI|nr:xylosidase: arabinofuranosidase [Colletotrichum karsti]KAF9876823.1 xylosidase: arabinofuranosidase [Colletotrichum karsti]
MLSFLSCLVFALWTGNSASQSLTSYVNPILPGWHSDPSCIYVEEWNQTYFCTTSSFLAFPGAPLYASKDLINWQLASNAYHREDQVPGMLESAAWEQEGLFANTLRVRDGVMHLITAYVRLSAPEPEFLLFSTTDPFDTASWTGPVRIQNPAKTIDPDLFWDEDGTLYISSSGIYIQSVNLTTGEVSQPVNVWNGTGGSSPEGPHIYKKDNWYYLLIAEGGTELNHAVTIARSKDIYGPYESNPNNPILTNRNTTEYFQTVGHADLFQDAEGNWWATALSTRSGPKWKSYPMGRETVLAPAVWEEGEWPVISPIRGNMSGPLPPTNRDVPGSGAWVDQGDVVDFAPGSAIPSHFVHWRPPRSSDYEISSQDGNPSLALTASKTSLSISKYPNYVPTDGQTFIGRLQSHTTFNFSIDVTASLTSLDQETGLTVFLTGNQHIDLGIVMLSQTNSSSTATPHVRLQTDNAGPPNVTVPAPNVIPVPESWKNGTIRLRVECPQGDTYLFSAIGDLGHGDKQNDQEHSLELGEVSAEVVSGGSGPFTGVLLGAYATTNGGNATFKSYISRWRYDPAGQKIE